MPRPPAITEAEWHLMKRLWDADGQWLTPGEIVEPVARERNIHHRTARTLLARLVKKGAVETRPDDFGNRYRAKVGKDAVVRQESRSFLSRVFDGKAAPALVHLLQESHDRLSADEIAALRKLLEREEKA